MWPSAVVRPEDGGGEDDGAGPEGGRAGDDVRPPRDLRAGRPQCPGPLSLGQRDRAERRPTPRRAELEHRRRWSLLRARGAHGLDERRPHGLRPGRSKRGAPVERMGWWAGANPANQNAFGILDYLTLDGQRFSLNAPANTEWAVFYVNWGLAPRRKLQLVQIGQNPPPANPLGLGAPGRAAASLYNGISASSPAGRTLPGTLCLRTST